MVPRRLSLGRSLHLIHNWLIERCIWVYLLSSVSSLPDYGIKFYLYFSGSWIPPNPQLSGVIVTTYAWPFEYVIICLRYSLWMSGNLFLTLHRRQHLTMNAVSSQRNRAGGWSHLSFALILGFRLLLRLLAERLFCRGLSVAVCHRNDWLWGSLKYWITNF